MHKKNSCTEIVVRRGNPNKPGEACGWLATFKGDRRTVGKGMNWREAVNDLARQTEPPDEHHDGEDFYCSDKTHQTSRDRERERRDYVANCGLRLVDPDGMNVLEKPLSAFSSFLDKASCVVVWCGKHYRINARVSTGIIRGASHKFKYEIIGREITKDDPLRDYEREVTPFLLESM